jgi:putative ABC transport system permease protein
VSKEIGVRKVLGASTSGVVALLSRQFMKWVVLANAAAWPVAYTAVTKWLQAFAYRIEITVWIFLASGLTALIIAFLAIGARTVRAAEANPVGTLRYE